MLIGIISDTHDNAINLEKAVEQLNNKKVELVFHCGDWVSPFMPDFAKNLNCKIISIFGNNEGDKFRFLTRQKNAGWNIDFVGDFYAGEYDGRKIAIYHGDAKEITEALLDCQKYDAVFTGHTHDALKEKSGNTLHINPGSISGLSNSEKGKPVTIAIYDTATNDAEIVKID